MAKEQGAWSPEAVRDFFARSDYLDYRVLRPLAHIRPLWEIIWDRDTNTYEPERGSFATMLNELVDRLARAEPPARYHDHEDRLAEFARDKFGVPIRKVGNRWEGADYPWVLEQGAYKDGDQGDLVLAAAGRVRAAIQHGQISFDEMEKSHQRILAEVLTIIIFQMELHADQAERDYHEL